jgi:hypothetical protein
LCKEYCIGRMPEKSTCLKQDIAFAHLSYYSEK